MITEYSDIVQRLSRIQCIPQKLELLKAKYKSDIASNRVFEKINSLSEFIKILEKRDIINEESLELLEDIACVVGIPDLLQPIHRAPVLPASPPNVFHRITYIIGRDIGHRWKDFARELNIREGDIDALEMRHRDVSDRVRDIMNLFMENCPAHLLKTSLIRALSEARRKDLSYEISAMIDNQNAGYM